MSDGRSPYYRCVQFILRRVIFPYFGGIEFRGIHRIPLSGPVILAPNHLSYLDPPAVGTGFPRYLASMAREDIFKSRLGPIMRSINVFPIKRGTGDTEAIRHSLEVLAKGHAILIFPEGTRGAGDILGAMSPGVAMLAKRSGAAIVPTGIIGTETAMPKHGKGRRCRTIINYGEPFWFVDVAGEGSERAKREQFNQELSRRIVAVANEGGLPIRLPALEPAKTESDN